MRLDSIGWLLTAQVPKKEHAGGGMQVAPFPNGAIQRTRILTYANRLPPKRGSLIRCLCCLRSRWSV